MRNLIPALACLLVFTAEAAEPDSTPVETTLLQAPALEVPAPAPAPLPPMNFSSSVAADPLFQRVKAVPAFSRTEQNLPGSPISLRVTHTLQPTAGGQAAGLLSAIIAGSTLGLTPLVITSNLVLSYEVSVNGKVLLSRDFERAFTRAQNMWAMQNDPTYGLGEEGLAWAIETATQFAEAAADHPALAELAEEYRFYFSEAR
ncbi:MAG: hypothetical protein ACO3LH_08880 [Steroidobacteraceae bacterium]